MKRLDFLPDSHNINNERSSRTIMPRSVRMKILRASFVFFFFTSLIYGQQLVDVTIGVCPFKPVNTSQLIADRFSDLFAATLAVDGKLVIKDRAALIDELAEGSFPVVEDANTAALVGKQIGLDAVVFGVVTQVETGYTLKVSLVNVTQSRVIYEQTMDYLEGSVTLYSQYKGILADLLAKTAEGMKPLTPLTTKEKQEQPPQKPEVKKEAESSSTIYWIIGGVVVGGGVLAAVLISGSKGGGGTEGPSKLPEPPNLP